MPDCLQQSGHRSYTATDNAATSAVLSLPIKDICCTQDIQFWNHINKIIFEQFSYGFGFTAYVLFLIYIADGPFKTAHYAFGTGIMAFSMFIPGLFAGIIQENIGYELFFVWVCVCTIPGIIASFLVKKKIL